MTEVITPPETLLVPVSALFAADGPVAPLFPGYEVRPGQIELTRAMAQALALDEPLLAEAGCGIGKSLSYLLAIVRSGQRAIIATHTKALQEQLWRLDIPRLQQLYPGLQAAVLKGRQNYLCRLELDRLDEAEAQGELFFTAKTGGDAYHALQAWIASGAADAAGGDLEHLPVALPDDLRQRVTVDSRDCLGRKCSFYETCYSQQAKARAQAAEIVIVNHALLLFDLALTAQTDGEVSLLPPAPLIVLDEGHWLEEVATEVFGVRVTGARWRAVESRLTALGKTLVPLWGRRRDLLRDFETLQTQAAQSRDAAETWLADRLTALGTAQARRLDQVCAADGLAAAKVLIMQTAAVHEATKGLGRAIAQATTEEEGLRWTKLAGQVARLLDDSRWALGLTPDDPEDPLVRSIERTDGGRQARAVLRGRPLRVDRRLDELLWTPRRVLAVSATLATGSGPTAFDYWRERVGVTGGVTRVIPSPFPFRDHARLYVPRDAAAFDPSLPAHKAGPGLEAYQARVLTEVAALLDVRQGGAFGLFTSHRMVRLAAEALSGRGETLLVQGQAPPAVLLERFKADGQAILLGTRMFWEGVDIPGTALSLVIIDRLPFAVPDDPLWEAQVEAAGDAWFRTLALPRTLMALKQAFGRLLRRMDDTGCVAILDGRLSSKTYGRSLIAGLPPAQLVRSVEDVAAFFQEVS